MKEYNIVGKRVPRTDSLAKATGSAKFTRDIFLPGMLCGKLLRSPHPHARILNIDTTKAEALPGVKAVVTGKDTIGFKWGQFKAYRDMYLLAIDKIRFVGEEVAAVAAIDEDIAEEALGLIDVEYEILPAVFDPFKAMEDGAPQLHDYAERNIGVKSFRHYGDVEKGFRMSDHVYEDRFASSRIAHVPMEPYAAVASFNPSGKIDMWIPNQSPFIKRRALSLALDIPLANVRLHRICIGGAFGGRTDTSAGEFCAALLSIKTQRPVKITYSREETMMATRHKHSIIVDLKVGAKRDGSLVSKDIKLVLDGGAYMSSGVIATHCPYTSVEALYRVPNVRYDAVRVYTNKTPCSMQRTHGSILWAAEEAIMDRIGRDLGIDPMEIRLKNAVRAGEILHSKSKVTSFALSETIEKAAEASRWKEKRGRLSYGHGIGMASAVCIAGLNLGFRLNSLAYIKFNPEDGSATLFTGNVDNGQGNESMMVQVAAEELGLPMEDIALVCADSELTPQDPGSYIMTSAFCSAEAVRRAAVDARRQIVRIAARRLGVEPSDVQLKDRRVWVKGKSTDITIANVVTLSLLQGKAILGRGSYTPRAMSKLGWSYWAAGKMEGQEGGTYTPGTTVAEVEVDLETGKVKVLNIVQAYDCGFAINPMAVEGQWEGEAVQMLGETLCEKHVWAETGELVTASFLDYRMPTALDIPNITPIIVESIDPLGPYGAKEVGINAGLGVEAAIFDAICDAIGVRVKEAPITPETILKALEEKERVTVKVRLY